MSKTILVAGDATRWVHLTGGGRPSVHSRGSLGILRELIGAWCDDDMSVTGAADSLMPPAEYFEWKQFGKAWHPVACAGSDRTPENSGILYEPNPAAPDVLVLLEGGRDFSRRPELWPLALAEESNPGHIVLHLETLPDPVTATTGLFWKRLRALHDRVTVILDAESLRARGAALSRGLSWDRTIEETVSEMTEGLSAADLALSQRTIITFGLSGAGVFTGREMERFLYEPSHVEGLWEQHRPGLPIMTGLAMAAAAARHAANPIDNPLFIALQDAFNFASTWHESGDDPAARFTAESLQKAAVKARTTLQAAAKHSRSFFCAYPHEVLDDPAFRKQPQTQSDLLRDVSGAGLEYTAAKAAQVVISGLSALDAVPNAQFGRFFTVDRDEIERLHTIRRQIESYRSNIEIDRPLSLAVFGQPGSGKSFAIKQLAKELFGDEAQIFEFNLSQFHVWEDLVLAFHRIRDAGAKGRIPFVFWDEFDTDDFKWLKHFLAPMQDGEFHSAGHAFPFGRGIFVFAGSVAHTMSSFQEMVAAEPAKKGRDFISRLLGHLDVKGPNPVRVGAEPCKPGEEAKPEDDPAHLIRRAIMLRVAIERFHPQIVDGSKTAAISPAIVRAFLRARRFLHGARSLEALVSQSRVGSTFEPADLPPEAVIRMQVDRDFLEHLRQGQLGIPVIEALARECHQYWRREKEKQGWKYAQVRDDAKLLHDGLIDFEKAPRRYAESSRHTARLTEAKLRAIGLRIVRRGDGTPAKLDRDRVECLVNIEHDIWLRDYLSRGYEAAEQTRETLRQHRCAQAFEALQNEDKRLDVEIAGSIEPTLTQFGYQLIEG